MGWLIFRIVLLLIFIASAVQLYLEPSIEYLISVLASFGSFIAIKGPITRYAESLNSPSDKTIDDGIEKLRDADDGKSFLARRMLIWAMRHHRNPGVRFKAAVALADIGDNRSLPKLINHLDDPTAIQPLKNIKIIKNKKVKQKLFTDLEKYLDDNNEGLESSEYEYFLAAISAIIVLGRFQITSVFRYTGKNVPHLIFARTFKASSLSKALASQLEELIFETLNILAKFQCLEAIKFFEGLIIWITPRYNWSSLETKIQLFAFDALTRTGHECQELRDAVISALTSTLVREDETRERAQRALSNFLTDDEIEERVAAQTRYKRDLSHFSPQ